MKLTKITLGLMLSLPMISFADFNPATVFSSPSSASGQSAASTSPGSSAYVQASPLVTPATTPVSIKSSTTEVPSSGSNALPYPTPAYPHYSVPGASATTSTSTTTIPSNMPGGSNVVVPIPSPSGPITPVIPNSGSGSGGSGQSLLAQINQGVQSINTNMPTWRSQDATLMQSAGANLVASTPNALNDFLNNQAGYSNFAQLLNTSNLSPSPVSIDFNLMPQAGANLGLLLNANAVSLPLGAKSLPVGFSSVAGYVAHATYGNMVAGANISDSAGTSAVVSSAFTALADQNLPTSIMTSSSFMTSLAQAVNAPFVNTPDPASNQTWIQQLSTASSPQILRTLAIQLALQNQMQYQQIQNQQILIALLSNIAMSASANEAATETINKALLNQTSQLNQLITYAQQIRSQNNGSN